MEITVRVEWDMGHRLHNHDGLCKQLHGHRYVAEVSVHGTPSLDTGMVVDFGPIKRAVREHIGAHYDHRFLVYSFDPIGGALAGLPGVRQVNYIPTAENIAMTLLHEFRLDPDIREMLEMHSAALASLRLYETPTSWVDMS